ncbi:hypothetical protein GCM10025859_04030 [Alicyclobacillus fastidiosus]|nr:hypothetical protein GCM10025859_04030 [Alicyclobacillus fastidiosus]
MEWRGFYSGWRKALGMVRTYWGYAEVLNVVKIEKNRRDVLAVVVVRIQCGAGTARDHVPIILNLHGNATVLVCVMVRFDRGFIERQFRMIACKSHFSQSVVGLSACVGDLAA